MRRGRGTTWTVKEEQLLREMIAANVSDTLMLAKLKRSPGAIRMRMLKLGERVEEKTDRLATTPEWAGISPIKER